MWRRGGTSDALERARALLAARSDRKRDSSNEGRTAAAEAGRRAGPTGESDLSSEEGDSSPLVSSREGSDTRGKRFLKKPPPPVPTGWHRGSPPARSQPGSQESVPKRPTRMERGPGSDPSRSSERMEGGGRPGSNPSRTSARRGAPRSEGSPRGRSPSVDGEEAPKPGGDGESASGPVSSQRSSGRASPPPRPPSGDGPASGRSPAPEEVLSLEELFPLGSDASLVSSRLDFGVDEEWSADDVGSAPLGDALDGTAEEGARLDGKETASASWDGSVPDCCGSVRYQSDFESAGGMQTDGQVSEEEEAAAGTAAAGTAVAGTDASRPSMGFPSRPVWSSPSGAPGRLPSSPAVRFKDAGAQTEPSAWRAPLPAPTLALTERLRRQLESVRGFARTSRGKREAAIRGLGPPAYTYATLRRTLELIGAAKMGRADA